MKITTDDIAKLIRDVRTAGGLTLEQMGKKLGVDISTVYKWEHGSGLAHAVRVLNALENLGVELRHVKPGRASSSGE